MRILLPKDGQTYLYFYKNDKLDPSGDVKAIKKLLRECGCKVGPEWKRVTPVFYECSSEWGTFKLVADVPAAFIEASDSSVICNLALALQKACHIYKINETVRLKNSVVVRINEYEAEDYLVENETGIFEVKEDDISCRVKIPGNIIGKTVKVSVRDTYYGEYIEYEGIVLKVENPVDTELGIMRITIEIVDDLGDEEPMIYEQIICEDEIIKLQVLDDC